MASFVAVDTGGTFTDLVAFDSSSQRVRYTKSLTTHTDPLDGIMECVRKTGMSLNEAVLFKHGTTLVVNTLIERSGPTVALVTTRGFRDVLDLGRGNRSDQYDLFFRRDPSLIKRKLRFEVDERIDGQGDVLIAPSRKDVELVAKEIQKQNATAVAISFINSYLEPAHENLVADWLRELLPECFVTTGTELSREWYEFERTSTAAASAYSGPKVSKYVSALSRELENKKFLGQLLIMGSNGGMLAPDKAIRAPVMLVESGPIGGCIGAGFYGQALSINNLIAFDMGGTTAKCALVRDGKFDVVSNYYLGGYGKGIPIRTSVIDIVEVGAGGGSIAWLDQQNRMHVGPRSAGSMPGPVCYGRGGQEPTITDANLVLGRLNGSRFQGGEMALNEDAARIAIDESLAAKLGYVDEDGLYKVAAGILDLAVVTMSGAIKRITVEKGKDPRDFTLFAYGGGGPLHAVDLARELSIPTVIIPPEPGNFSAIGMLLANIRLDDARTFLRPLENGVLSPLLSVFQEMNTNLRSSLEDSFGDIPITFERFAEMRFVGQFHSVRVKVEESVDRLRQSFEEEYLSRYGHLMRAGKIEFVSLHAMAFGETPRPNLSDLFARIDGQQEPNAVIRKVYFSGERRAVDARVFSRVTLPKGFSSEGPAVIEEYGSTTIVGPSDCFEIGPLGEIRIKIDQPQKGKLPNAQPA